MRCPAFDCSAHGPAYLVTDPSKLQIPPEIIESVGDNPIYRCSYCQFIWYEWTPRDSRTKIRTAIGFYDNFRKPLEFFATPNYRMAEPPTRRPVRKRSKGAHRNKRNSYRK